MGRAHTLEEIDRCTVLCEIEVPRMMQYRKKYPYTLSTFLMNKEHGLLEEFKTLYDIHHWLRYITWTGLVSAAIFLLWASGGFPPQAWLLLIESLPQIPYWWSINGAAILLPLITLVLLSAIWAMGWYSLGWVVLVLVRHHRRTQQAKQRHNDLVQSSLDWESSHNFSLATVFPGESKITEHTPDPQWMEETVHAILPEEPRKAEIPPAVTFPGEPRIAESNLVVSVPMMRLPQKHAPMSMPQKQTLVPLARLSPVALADVVDLTDRPTRPDSSKLFTATMTKPKIGQPLEVGIGWNAGLMRGDTPNEDGLLVLQGTCTYHGRLVPFGLFVVADGMGGHDCGQDASRIAVQCMMHTVLQNIMIGDEISDEFLTDMMIGGVQWANRTVCQYGTEHGKNLGTTLTAALVVDMKAYIVNVGDSRTYLYRADGRLSQITRDHSLVATLVAFGEITPEQIYTHPERNKVYRCLGTGVDDIEVDWFTADLSPHDRLLLCSDGLWEMVRDPEIGQILRNNRYATQACEHLVQAALQGGGVDNVSAIVVRVP